ncbi:MAG TPA: hypothetical protein VGF06_09070 [Terriglobales bacterium]|jgi:hypothetical protein
MKNLLLCLVLSCFVSIWALAQNSTTSDKAKAHTRTVTGCLAQGDSAGEYMLTATDGSMWELKSDSVPLAEHVGHTVAVTGAIENASAHEMKEGAKDAAAATGMKKHNHERGDLKVSDLKMVSDSCSK